MPNTQPLPLCGNADPSPTLVLTLTIFFLCVERAEPLRPQFLATPYPIRMAESSWPHLKHRPALDSPLIRLRDLSPTAERLLNSTFESQIAPLPNSLVFLPQLLPGTTPLSDSPIRILLLSRFLMPNYPQLEVTTNPMKTLESSPPHCVVVSTCSERHDVLGFKSGVFPPVAESPFCLQSVCQPEPISASISRHLQPHSSSGCRKLKPPNVQQPLAQHLVFTEGRLLPTSLLKEKSTFHQPIHTPLIPLFPIKQSSNLESLSERERVRRRRSAETGDPSVI